MLDSKYLDEDIKQAVTILKNGGLVVFPTDTVWGVGCAWDNNRAVERLFRFKKRPLDQPLQLLIANIERLSEFVDGIPHKAERLISKFWPGALTIIMTAKTGLTASTLIVNQNNGIGFRLPNHSQVRELIGQAGGALAATSANFHGLKTPAAWVDLDKDFVRGVDYCLKGAEGGGVESTVVDVSEGDVKILRQGAVDLS